MLKWSYHLSLVCTLLYDFTYTAHNYHAHENTHSTSTNHTNHNKQQMHVSRWVGKADFATGGRRDTQTYFYILPLAVNSVFAYNIFVLDVIRLAVNIGHYHRRRMRADIHTCMETDMQACVYACTHTRTHTYIHKYSCCFFPGCGKRPITHKEGDKSPAGIELTKFRQRKHRQLPIVQHVRFTPQRLCQ